MAKLGQLLVARGWITVQQLNRALQNQVVTGGRLGTSLLDMDALSEESLLKGLAEQLGVPAVLVDDLRNIPAEVLALVPEKVARRGRAIPFRLVGGRLDVAMMDPRNLATQDEVAFACGKRVNVHVAHELRILEALERHYSEEMPSRLNRLVERLSRARFFWDRSAGPETEAPKGAVDELPRMIPLSVPQGTLSKRYRPTGMPGTAGLPDPGEAPRTPPRPDVMPLAKNATPLPGSVPLPVPVQPPEPPARPRPVAPPPPILKTVTLTEAERAALNTPSPQPERQPEPVAAAATAAPAARTPPAAPEGPASADEVEEALSRTADREEVGRIALGLMVRSYRRAALFQVARERVSAWMAQGELDLPIFQTFSVGFDQPSIFLNLRQGSALYLGPLPPMPAHRELARAWGGELPRDCVLLPVRIKDRLVAVLYADGGTTKAGKAGGIDLPQLNRLAASTGTALERCILHRKRAEAG